MQLPDGSGRSEEFLSFVLENTTDVITIVNPDGTLAFWNAALERVLGYDGREFEEMSILSLVHPDDLAGVLMELEKTRLRPGMYGRAEYRIRHRDGRWVLLESRGRFFTGSDGRQGHIVDSRDITQVREREQALAETEGKLQFLAANLRDVIWSVDERMRFTYLSPSVTAEMGYTVEETLGTAARTMLAPEEWEKKVVPVLEEIVAADPREEAVCRTFEVRCRRRDGVTFWSEIKATFFRNPDGSIREGAGVTRDVSDRIDARERLAASLQEKDVLLREIHHRVKNNLLVVSSLLALQCDGIADETAVRGFLQSRDRINAMALVHDNLYRSENLISIALREYLQSLAYNLFDVYRGVLPGIDMQLEIADLRLDIDQAIPCGLIVNELLTNAFKHGFPDGGQGSVRLQVEGEGGRLGALTVIHDGSPLPEGFSLEESKGLGLRLVRLLAEQIGGKIGVERGGPGVRFFLSFGQGGAAGRSSAPIPPPV